MKTPGVALALVMAVLGAVVAAQTPASTDAKTMGYLKQLFPTATEFSPKGGQPPHFKAFANDPGTGSKTLLGVAFWTTELEPLERGYDGPITILVGMDPRGILTGIIVAGHREPYGDFSIDPPQFAAQFKGKNIRDPFTIGKDIDAVSRATLSVGSAARAVRKSSRRVATALFAPPTSSGDSR
jgi:transcriptional regulator of nitric oxide reductase